jgi:cell shape-determining protein MreD
MESSSSPTSYLLLVLQKFFFPVIVLALSVFLFFFSVDIGPWTLSLQAIYAVIFFWMIVQDRQMIPPWFAWALGLFQDMGSATPLGTNALLFLMVYILFSNQEDLYQKNPRAYLILRFAFMSGILFASQWLIQSFLVDSFSGFPDVLATWILANGIMVGLCLLFAPSRYR